MCHYEGIKKAIDYVSSKKNCYFIHLGDVIEAITHDDKRYTPPPEGHREANVNTPLKQAIDAVEIFRPIRKKIITILRGNHERKLANYGDVVDDIICRELKVDFGTECCRIILGTDNDPLFNIYALHGNKLFKSNAKDFEQREANKKAALKLYLQNQMGDCSVMLCGHAHWIGIVPPSKRLYFLDSESGVQQAYLKGQLISSDGYIYVDRRFYACCGSARKSRMDGHDDYAQIYEPNELGFVKIVVKDGQISNMEPFYI
jgi:predicted phosphodiesterase